MVGHGGGWIKRLASNSQSFDQRMIRLECRVKIKIKFHLSLILNNIACKLSERFSKFVLAIFPAKVLSSFGLTGQQAT